MPHGLPRQEYDPSKCCQWHAGQSVHSQSACKGELIKTVVQWKYNNGSPWTSNLEACGVMVRIDHVRTRYSNSMIFQCSHIYIWVLTAPLWQRYTRWHCHYMKHHSGGPMAVPVCATVSESTRHSYYLSWSSVGVLACPLFRVFAAGARVMDCNF